MIKRIFLSAVLVFALFAFVACQHEGVPSNDDITATQEQTTAYPEETTVEAPSCPEPEISDSVRAALEDFLGEMLPVFMRNGQGWRSFVQIHCHEDRWGHYPEAFTYQDPITGQRVHINDMPYLTMIELRDGRTLPAIATDFWLYDLDENDIPVLVVSWHTHKLGIADNWHIRFYRYINGSYQLAGNFQAPFTLYRDQHGRMVAGIWTYDRLMRLDFIAFYDGELVREPIIEKLNWPYWQNHLTGEQIFELEDTALHYIPGMPDEPLIAIRRLPQLEQSLSEAVTQRLLDEGRILSS